jgi:hypothetical protein
MPPERPETFEETFCRLASEVIKEHNLAPLPQGLPHEVERFIRLFLEKVKEIARSQPR